MCPSFFCIDQEPDGADWGARMLEEAALCAAEKSAFGSISRIECVHREIFHLLAPNSNSICIPLHILQ